MAGMRVSPMPPHRPAAVADASPDVDSDDHRATRPDARMRRADALAYWADVPATVDGMLGGYEGVSRADLQGSRNFVAKLRRRRQLRAQQQQHTDAAQEERQPQAGPWLERAADCGAGIGRITRGLLANVAAVVDVVEPVAKFTAEITDGEAFGELRDHGRLGRVWTVGLEDWRPDACNYDLVWNQWCLGHLTDAQLETFLASAAAALRPGGWVVVKENLSTEADGRDLFDATDSTITRSEASWKRCFDAAGLKVVAEELQRGLPRELYPVKMFALQPKDHEQRKGK